MGLLSVFRRLSLERGRTLHTKPKIEREVSRETPHVPDTQTVLVLHGPREEYKITKRYPIPVIQNGEILVKIRVIGLNPIDWKAPDYNFGIPELPYITGREAVGDVVQKTVDRSRVQLGERVIVISTDYRDLRKATYQQYVAASEFNIVKMPASVSAKEGAAVGVAFVAAALALGVCMGVDFTNFAGGPDLFEIIRKLGSENLPESVRGECLDSIRAHERATTGDWIAVWGGSATSANLIVQLARLAGLRVIAVVDKAKHGLRLSNHAFIRPDLLVDSHDPARAVQIIRANVGGKLRFGIDTRGRDTAGYMLQALTPGNTTTAADDALPSPPATPRDSSILCAHLIGLTGLPKQTPPEGTVFHAVPIKLFHEIPDIGLALATWLERLLEQGLVRPPDIVGVEEGLENVNKGLDRMRRGEISGGKLVVTVE